MFLINLLVFANETDDFLERFKDCAQIISRSIAQEIERWGRDFFLDGVQFPANTLK